MFKVLALDAMGVIYQSGDDVGDLLIPFVRTNGGVENAGLIEQAYLECSLGSISSEELWRRLGVDPSLEEAYLDSHVLVDGILEFLKSAASRFDKIICISNDVSDWSAKLRVKFGLDEFIDSWYISGEMKVRKPNRLIYETVLKREESLATNIIFVDDRPKNIESAQELGISGVLFRSIDVLVPTRSDSSS